MYIIFTLTVRFDDNNNIIFILKVGKYIHQQHVVDFKMLGGNKLIYHWLYQPQTLKKVGLHPRLDYT
jgi:hypothetical protein